MALEILDRNAQVNAVITERRRVAEAKERAELELAFDRKEEADLQKREDFEQRAETAVAEWAAKSDAAISVLFMNKRVTIRMDQPDSVLRDIARNAAHLLSQYVNRAIGEGVVMAKNTGRADAYTPDPLWLERLLSLDLQYAHARGLVTVQDVKTGKSVKLKTLIPSKAVTTSVQTSGVRDAWLSGGDSKSTPRRTMRA